jgi:hypothetical protein
MPEQFSIDLNNRLSQIKQLGTNANMYAAQQAQLQQQAAQAAAANNTQSLVNQGLNSYVPSATQSSSGSVVAPVLGKGNTFQNFISAITSQESGGNYNALGQPVGGDRAYGRYQIMGNNIPGWTKSALGHSLTPQQFLADRQAQDATAQHFLGNYYNKYGPAGAAVAWYAGEGTAQKYVKNPGAFNGSQGQFPSINAYAMSILKKMGLR